MPGCTWLGQAVPQPGLCRRDRAPLLELLAVIPLAVCVPLDASFDVCVRAQRSQLVLQTITGVSGAPFP